jgi:hypothetical protein
MKRLICYVALSLALMGPTSANVRIISSSGGVVGPYMTFFSQLRKSGQRVIIDGPRKGGVTPERVLNALDLSSFREYLRTRKMGRSNEQAPAPMAPFGLATRLHRDETRQGHRRRSQ